MTTADAFRGLVCLDCATTYESELPTHACPSCGGHLDGRYDLATGSLELEAASAQGEGIFGLAAVLPVAASEAVSLGEGATPLVETPALAEESGVEEFLIKDEGQNPTGAVSDREMAVAVTAATRAGAERIAVASTGDDSQSMAAYAARAGLEATTHLPSRASFIHKAMMNVHGGEMSVVEGRLGDALEAFEADRDGDSGVHSMQPFENPYRHEGIKTLLYELASQRAGSMPDHLIYPTGDGVGIVGLYKAAKELTQLGVIDGIPRLWAAQAENCAPVVTAWEADAETIEPVEYPDTICGALEVPAPVGGARILTALRESNGGGVALEDGAILSATVSVAESEGIEMGVAGGAAAAAAWELSASGEIRPEESVAVVNTATGNKDADLARSHLMSQGV